MTAEGFAGGFGVPDVSELVHGYYDRAEIPRRNRAQSKQGPGLGFSTGGNFAVADYVVGFDCRVAFHQKQGEV